MGGFQCNKLQVLEMSEENELTWTVKAELPAWRARAASAEFEGRLWLMGGSFEDGPTASVSTYDPASDSWAAGPALPRASDTFGNSRAAVHNGQLYLFQLGSTESPTFLYTNTGWVGAEEMRTGRIHLKGACESILLG